MRNKTFIILFTVIISMGLSACKCQKNCKTEKSTDIVVNESTSKILAPVIIYKTNADFSKNVAIMLNDEKTDILSYPDITDVYYQGKLAYPTLLANGYLLDNRGVGKNTAFIKYTYEEYSKLKQTPDKDELMKMIISKNPITELYKCNKLPKNDIEKLNSIIKNGLSESCENLIK